jgi:hypothetical protein
MPTTLPATSQPAVDPCPVCHGSGEVVADRVDPETGFHDADPCTWCAGDGTVPEGTCGICEGCQVPVVVDDNACAHRGQLLCDVCALERCAECRVDAEDDRLAAFVWPEVIRGGA